MIAKTVVLFKNDVQNINIARFMCECGKRTFPIEQVSDVITYVIVTSYDVTAS